MAAVELMRRCTVLAVVAGFACSTPQSGAVADDTPAEGETSDVAIPAPNERSDTSSTAVSRYDEVDWDFAARRSFAGRLVERWRHGSERDTLLTVPLGVAATRDGVFVYDAGRIHAFAALDGVHRWSFGRPGQGPREFGGVVSLNAYGDSLTAYDRSLQRLTVVGPDGDFVRSEDLRWLGQAAQACAVGSARYVLAVWGATRGLEFAVVGGSTEFLRTPIPWDDAKPLRFVAVQGRVDAIGNNTCAFGVVYASRIATITARGIADTFSLIEPVPLAAPETVSTSRGVGFRPRPEAVSSRGVARVSDYLVVAFGGSTSRKGRLLDIYGARDHAYIGSVAWPERILDIAGFGDDLYLVVEDSIGVPVLSSARLRRVGRK